MDPHATASPRPLDEPSTSSYHVHMPIDEHETKGQAMSDQRIIPTGGHIDATLLRSFLSAALTHDAAIDQTLDLVHESVAAGYHPAVVAGNLEPILTSLLQAATPHDWRAVADELIFEHPSNQQSNPEGSTTP